MQRDEKRTRSVDSPLKPHASLRSSMRHGNGGDVTSLPRGSDVSLPSPPMPEEKVVVAVKSTKNMKNMKKKKKKKKKAFEDGSGVFADTDAAMPSNLDKDLCYKSEKAGECSTSAAACLFGAGDTSGSVREGNKVSSSSVKKRHHLQKKAQAPVVVSPTALRPLSSKKTKKRIKNSPGIESKLHVNSTSGSAQITEVNSRKTGHRDLRAQRAIADDCSSDVLSPSSDVSSGYINTQPGAEFVSGWLPSTSGSIQPTVVPSVPIDCEVDRDMASTLQAELVDTADLEAEYRESFMKQATVAEVVEGRGFRFKCVIITAILAGMAIIGGTVVGAVIGTRNKGNEETPVPTMPPTVELRIRCEEECQGTSHLPVLVNGFDFKQAILDYLTDPSSSPYGSNINCWDVSQVTNMSWAFSFINGYQGDGLDQVSVDLDDPLFLNFSEPLHCWNTSSVTDMSWMFLATSSFNGEIGGWDVSSVTNMSSMFREAALFNTSLASWDTSNVTDMSSMFGLATDRKSVV